MSTPAGSGRGSLNTRVTAAARSLRSRSSGPVASNPSDHHAWPLSPISVSSTPHPGCPAAAGAPAWNHPLAGRKQVIRRALRTAAQPGWAKLPAVSGPQGKDHFRQYCSRPSG